MDARTSRQKKRSLFDNDILEGINANCFLSVGVLTGADDNFRLKKAHYIINSVMDIEVATNIDYPLVY